MRPFDLFSTFTDRRKDQQTYFTTEMHLYIIHFLTHREGKTEGIRGKKEGSKRDGARKIGIERDRALGQEITAE